MNITFTCPNCGCHQLIQIRQTIHRAEVKLSFGPTGELIATPVGMDEKLQGPILGYRCRKCRYPDNQNHDDAGGFFWNQLIQVQAASAISTGSDSTTPHRCMICHNDGRTEALIIKCAGPLSAEHRRKILTRLGLSQAVIISEGDAGIATFENINWQNANCEEI